MKQGIVVILSGVSSVGKSEIRRYLLNDDDLKLLYSVSETTRPQKEDEVDGVDYYFVSHEAFANSVKKKQLLEYTEFNGYYYGTPRAQVEHLINMGKNVLIEVEAQGVGSIKMNIERSIAFYVIPRTFEDLEKHIRDTYRDDEASITRRLNKARMDLEIAPLFKHVVYNDDPLKAYKEIKEQIYEKIERLDKEEATEE
ncbi:MAG: guanylate kinase [Erysipelotrichaceae bacterium]|nr:guanylate kinase [Erysipelotrichaceae bacterium]